MKILHLIDTLRPGGAERMVVNLANGLYTKGQQVHVCTSRADGVLCDELHQGIPLLSLRRRCALDVRALWRFVVYLKRHQITHLHAHGTSFFWAWLASIFLTNMRLIWHDHQGNRDIKYLQMLKICSWRMNMILCVNKDLVEFAHGNLKSRSVHYISNFISEKKMDQESLKDIILLAPKTFRIIVVANITPPKDHQTLLEAFQFLLKVSKNISLHIIGAPTDRKLDQELKEFCTNQNLSQVFFYGNQFNPHYLMTQADLGVLSSKSEGLPLGLLEYGLAGLPVVVTSVGACKEVVQDHGLVVPPQNPKALFEALLYMLEHPDERCQMAADFRNHVTERYQETQVIKELINHYAQLN
ncbi:MAG: glycosyltransferase [Flavobacteriaceae bacterium]|nr:glycosyltransferase [Flavobacteriaceae bacterium]